MDSKYDALVLSGGGVRGLLQIGSLRYILTFYPDLLKNIKIFSGCSIGTLISYFHIIGLTPNEIFSSWSKFDISKFAVQENVSTMLKTYGFYTQESIIPFFSDISLSRLGIIPTLKQLKDLTGKSLLCSVYNLTDAKIEYLTPETHPDLSCIDAILMSCCIPFLFPPFVYNKKEYIDSSIVCNLPVDCLDSNTKALCIDTSMPVKEWSTKNIFEYVYKLLNTGRVFYQPQKMQCMDTICLKYDTDLKMTLTKLDRANLFMEGYEQTKEYFHSI